MAAEKKDFYESLGVSKDAGEEDIKKAYRKMAKQYHPDVNPGDAASEAKFKEISEAYEILSDPEKKSRYDRFGHAGVDPSYSGGGGAGFEGFGGFDDLGDILNSFFGGGRASARSRNAPRKGDNVGVEVIVSFEEAAFGCERNVDVTRIEECEKCAGSGAREGTTPETCTECGGSGTVTSAQRTMFGMMQSTVDCPTCQGRGKTIKNPCDKCKGLGRVRRKKKINVKIPAGIDDGQRINMRGQGSAGLNGGTPGDLYISVTVLPHRHFVREGNAVLYEMPISFAQAALGDELEVPTLDGKVKYKIPEGTQTGTVFRLRGKGIPNLHRESSRGDQFVTVRIATPTGLTAEQKELLRQFAALRGGDVPPLENEEKPKKKKKK
ncbi:MAG: molecular chaperone DnaJ [Clostridiales bacterium]|nr:molecular chaperone DnaJ [Clostridiales bacterium]